LGRVTLPDAYVDRGGARNGGLAEKSSTDLGPGLSANLKGVIRVLAIAALVLGLSSVGQAQALSLQQVGGSFDQPIYVTSDPGDPGRLFVVEREGTIEQVQGGVTRRFADVSAQVQCLGSCQGERGLMSIAMAPDFDRSGRFFVDYANDLDGTIHVAELVAPGPGHESALGATPRNLVSIAHAEQANHNGGQLQFGPDGKLYVSTGDGGGGNDELHNAQNPGSRLGKILRLDPDAAVPTAAIWSSGLRNPFRFSFDRLSGDMVIGDVGQDLWEEVDLAPSPMPGVVGGSGANYGWNCKEGPIDGPPPPDRDPECATPPAAGFVAPVFAYPQTVAPGEPEPCAIIGGYVVRDPGLSGLYGRYLFGDLCVGELRSVDLTDPGAGDRSEGIELTNLNSFGEDSCGRLYAVEGGGRVFRLQGSAPTDCSRPAQSSPPPQAQPRLTPTFVRFSAQRRRVERGKRALLTVFISPCDGRRGQTVELLRNGRANGTRFLSRACTARFLPRIRTGTTFVAATRQERSYQAGKSRRLTIRLAHRRHH
jgi:hypothetical protein